MAENDWFNEDHLAKSEAYADAMEKAILPYLKEKQKEISVRGAGGRELYCVSCDAQAPRGTVLVLHGFTENAYKFSELIYSLLQNGFSVVAYDQRGHGRSCRDEAVRADQSLTHVDRFGEYVEDLEAVCEQALSGMPKPWMIFSHSMGGAVTALYLEQHPETFAKAAMCAPMIAPCRNNIPLFAVMGICRGEKLLGKGKKRIFLSKPYAGPEDFATSCATGKERFDWYDGVKAANKEFWNNGPTYAWTLESMKVTARILAPGAVEKIACPVRLYTADDDSSVLPEEQKQFIARVKNGTHQFVKGSRHEIYRSSDDVLFPWWHDVLAFLKAEQQ